MLNSPKVLVLIAIGCLATACGAAPQLPQKSPGPATRQAAGQAVAAPERSLPVPSAAVAAVPASCEAFSRAIIGCPSSGATLRQLAQALGESNAELRDAALARLQECEEFAPGVVLALRAEAAAVECGDVIIGSRLPDAVPDDLAYALTALVHAAHLKRLVVRAPHLTPPFNKQDFAEFSKSVLNDWVVTQAEAIHRIASEGAKLSGYARGVVAVEAGLSDMRFVRVVRELPLPEEMAHDDELQEAYYSELDIALGPWKDRGRDAALVGLRELAAVGVLFDPRVQRARQLLSELYGGRRIDRLDGLVLPTLPPAPQATVAHRLALALPTYLLEFVLPNLDVSDTMLLRVLLERGIPKSMRADLETRALEPGDRALLARGLIQSGQLYWRSADFRAALKVLGPLDAAPEPEYLLLRGVAEALQAGPNDAVQMMLRGVSLPPGVEKVAALDALAQEPGALAAAAAFNAAYILELAPPPGDAGFWRSLQARYARAAGSLEAVPDRVRATELARAAGDTAKALER